ncbi:unnamed protein product [Paramecium primaurelia]|uniref:WD40-repeat-containing domain n=1 Tax=Paramecium primaurelia TaxID=5886 RepID=A0A8S1PUD1_PARPR|nr:unnamed protein product [Paramecium primaurelia]
MNTKIFVKAQPQIIIKHFQLYQERIMQEYSYSNQGNQNNSKYFQKYKERRSLLICCYKDGSIIIWSLNLISNPKYLFKLRKHMQAISSFITNGLFAFQSRIPRNRLFLYQLDENTQMFNKLQDVIVEGVGGNKTCAIFFPLVYIDNKQILISKNGQKINLIKLTFSPSNQLFNQIQTIDYGFQPNGWLFGTVTQDGEYLITWDQKSKNIQIRSYQEKIMKQEQN